MLTDPSVPKVLSGAIANVGGVKKEDVRIVQLSPLRRLKAFLAVSEEPRRLSWQGVKVVFTLTVNGRDAAEKAASSLSGVSYTSMRQEIEWLMAKAGKPYRVQVHSVNAVRFTGN